MRYAVLALLAVYVGLLPTVVRAQPDVTLEIDATDNPLRIAGWLGTDEAFVGNLRITARGGNTNQLIFLPSDLKRQDGDEIIGRQHITLIGTTELTAEHPRDLQVKVSGVSVRGTYTGTIEFLVPEQPRGTARVPIEVVVRERPTLTPLAGTDKVQLRLVRCQHWLLGLDCGLARLFLSESAFSDSFQLQFDNPGRALVTVLHVDVALMGEHTRAQVTGKGLQIPAGPSR